MSSERERTSRFTVLWLKAQPILAGYVGSMVRDRAAADDILQSVALTSVEKLDEYEPDRSFEAWVVGIARYKVLQYYREVDQDRLIFDDQLADAYTRHFADAAQGYEQRVDALRDCIDKLPEDGRALLNNRYFDQQSVKSIAAMLGKTPARISKQLFSLRRALEQCIEQRLRSQGGAR
ncbi:MAG: sigma-70 family RNA polymerase sigma factor [Phycisphaeraceae bacterium]